VARPVGRSGQRLSTHFALVADVAAVRLVAEAKAAFVRDALGGDVPVLGAAAPFRTGGRMGPGGYADIPAGRLAARHLAELYPFPNLLRAVRLDGRQVRRWLEQSAAMFNRIAPGDRDVPLLMADAPGYAFDLISGLTFEIRVDRPVGQRIADLRLGGVPVADDAAFVVASNSYRVAAAVPEAVPVLAGDVPVREVLERHVAAGGAARIGDGPGWRLRLPAGASVVFPTAPAARVPAEGLGGLAAFDLGLGADGFRRVRLTAGKG
jgi:2',3'-cyclic-nucleotide 2'-phosphodiesterase/3'-nucleotidase